MVEKFKFVLLEYYCCGLAYPSHFYWGSLQGVFTLANILQYLYIQISDIPEKATLTATMQCLLIVPFVNVDTCITDHRKEK